MKRMCALLPLSIEVDKEGVVSEANGHDAVGDALDLARACTCGSC